jgi:phospholipase A1
MNPILSVARLSFLALAVLATLAWAASSTAHAQTATQGIGECATIAADTERLACYDRASGRRAEPLPAPIPVTGPVAPPADAFNAAPKTAPATDTTAQSAVIETPPASLIDNAWGFDPAASRYTINVYHPNYLLVANYSDNPNQAPFNTLFDALNDPDAQLDSTEAQFQISFKARIWATEDRRFGIWVAYTQQSQWQLYNPDLSRPFRETNYEPEVMVSYNPDYTLGGFRWALFNFGYNHQSNGRADPLSRSWDRIVAEFGIERGNFALLIRPWLITDDGGDDNPDIADYMGHGDITAVYKWHGHSFTLMGRGNANTGKGAGRLTWTTPPLLGPLRGYVNAFSGYGESMIDYNWRQNTFGIGVTLNDVLDRL